MLSLAASENTFNTVEFNPLSANPTKWSNTLKQFVGNLPTNYLSVFDHFVKLARKGLKRLHAFKELKLQRCFIY